MTREQAINYLGGRTMDDIDTIELLRTALDHAREIVEADGCDGCAFMSVEEWEMPCKKCARNCKDYYRRTADGEKVY